jgi:beta-glucosidase
VLEFVKRATNVSVSTEEGTRDHPEDRALNRRLAADSLVLLKNESNILPLKPGVKSIALIGPNMKIAAFCGGGSAALQPYYAISPFQGITDQLSNDVNVKFEVGAYSYAFVPLLEASPSVTTPEGQPGLRMRFYREPPSTPDRPVIEELILPDSAWELMDFSHPDLGKLYYADVEASVMAPTTGPYEFAVAVHGTANVFIDDELIIDNSTVQRGGSYCFGKGTVEEKATVQFTQGRQYKLRVEYASAPSSKLVKPGVVAYGAGAGRLGMIEVVAPELLIARAVEAARKADVAVICAGLTKDHECEGYDRAHMDLPGSVSDLISAVLAAAPDTIVVSQSGTPINMLPWANIAKAHIHAWFGGNETGNGIADVIFGKVNPGGKLPLSFPRRIEDNPTFLNFGSERGRVVYGEGIYVGYRYYEKALRDVLYPFG